MKKMIFRIKALGEVCRGISTKDEWVARDIVLEEYANVVCFFDHIAYTRILCVLLHLESRCIKSVTSLCTTNRQHRYARW